MDWRDLKALKKLDGDDVLGAIGLQRRDSTDWLVPTLTAFSIGVVVGVGVGMILAPKPGAQLRSDLRSRIGGGDQTGSSTAAGVGSVERQRTI